MERKKLLQATHDECPWCSCGEKPKLQRWKDTLLELSQQSAEVRALREALEGVRKDAERLDWLESQVWAGDLLVPGLEVFGDYLGRFADPCNGKTDGEVCVQGKSYIREAIDAALESRVPKPSEEVKP